jgi:hypothetical protein
MSIVTKLVGDGYDPNPCEKKSRASQGSSRFVIDFQVSTTRSWTEGQKDRTRRSKRMTSPHKYRTPSDAQSSAFDRMILTLFFMLQEAPKERERWNHHLTCRRSKGREDDSNLIRNTQAAEIGGDSSPSCNVAGLALALGISAKQSIL